MSKTVKLPGHQSAVILSHGEVSERVRRSLMAEMGDALVIAEPFKTAPDGTILTDDDGHPVAKTAEEIGVEMMGGGGAVKMADYSDRILLALIKSWTLDLDLTVESLLDLPGETYEALFRAADPGVTSLLPVAFSVTSEKDSPTTPSGD